MFKKILPLLLFASPLAAQVQYEIIDVPVCWNDSSLIKYVYVTTSGAYADLGYYNAEGLPVTVTGATPTPGFCADALTIDSTAGRSFTITLGDQTVTWVDSVGSGTGGSGVDKLADLLDVDTTGKTDGSIILYDAVSGNWEAQANSIDNLTDGYYDINLNLFLGKNPSYIVPGSLSARFNVGYGYFALDSIGTGYDNTAIGTSAMYSSKRGSYRNTALGRAALGGATHTYGFRDNYHANGVAIGAFSAANDTLFFESITIGNEAGNSSRMTGKIRSLFIGGKTTPLDTLSVDQIVIGAYAIPKGDSTVVIGREFYKGTYLHGNLNLNGYGLGNKEATDLTKTRSAYIAAFATDGTLLELDTTGLFGGGSGTPQTLTFSESTRELTISDGNTIDLSEGIQEEINSTLVAGTGITITYDDGAGTLTVAAPAGSGNTDEQTLSINEATAELTISNGNTVDLSESIQDEVATLLQAGSNVTLTYDDGAGTLTIAATGGGGATNLGDLGDVTITSATTGQVLKYDGTKWINDTLSVSSGGVLSVTANNGLTNSGTATQPVIELGGTLSKNTTVSGDAKSIYFNNNLFYYIDTVFSFLVRPSVNEVANTFNIGAAANSWRSINTTDGIGNLVQIQANNTDDGVFLSSYLTATTTTFTKLELLPEEVQLITPDVNAGTATAGQVLTLVNAATGEVEFSSPATGIGLTDLSVTVATAGTANLSYNNTNGVFTYTPPDLSGYLTSEVDGSTTNELQNLSLAGTTLSISDGNSVDLSGFLRDTLTGTQTIVGNTNDYIFNGINDYQINLTGDKAFYVGHSKMYIRFDATEMKLYSSETPINIQGAAGVNLEFAGGDYKFDNTAMQLEAYGSGNKEAGDLSKTSSNYKAAFSTDGTLIEVSNVDAMVVACSDETTDITTGTAKVTFRAPHAMTIVGVRASLTTASSSGDPTVDINEGGTSILGTKLTIDATEKTSTTAATAATITDTAIADDAEITIDVDAAGTGATGLKVTILYRKN